MPQTTMVHRELGVERINVYLNLTPGSMNENLLAVKMTVMALIYVGWLFRRLLVPRLGHQIRPTALASPLVILLKISEPPYATWKTFL
jgi:hypothetical protein